MISKKFRKANLILSIILIVFFIQDTFYDIVIESEYNIHSYMEVVLVVVMSILFIYQVKEFKSLSSKLGLAEETVSKFKKELSSVINDQFSFWGFTPAESEVGWLILKGFSYPDIANLREVSEKTINQQVGVIFKKSHVKNRHEFVSSFIEDLL